MQWGGLKIYGAKIAWSSSQRGGFQRKCVLCMYHSASLLQFMPEKLFRQGLTFNSNEDDRSCGTLELAGKISAKPSCITVLFYDSSYDVLFKDSDFLEELPLVHQVTLNPPSSSSS